MRRFSLASARTIVTAHSCALEPVVGFRCVDEADNAVDATVEDHARIKIQGEIGSWRGVAKISAREPQSSRSRC